MSSHINNAYIPLFLEILVLIRILYRQAFKCTLVLSTYIALPLDMRRMLAVILMESFKKRQDMQVVAAATEAGSIMGYNERTVRKYREEFFLAKESWRRRSEASTCVAVFTMMKK